MSRTFDNFLAFRILKMLVTPFNETGAFALGIIDKKGNKIKDPVTEDEKDSYDYLARLVFNLKKLINKSPGGESKIKNIMAALYLVKESYKHEFETIYEEDYQRILDSNVILAEETLEYKMFIEDVGVAAGGGLAGQGQSTPSTEPSEPVNRSEEHTSELQSH